MNGQIVLPVSIPCDELTAQRSNLDKIETTD